MAYRFELISCLVVLSISGQVCAAETAPVSKNLPVATKDDKALYDTDDPTIVKKSRQNICHDRMSASFATTLHYKAYRTMQDCLDSGGRRPR